MKNYIKFKKEPYVIAEIGINHNGIFKLAKKLIYESKKAGADAVKFQKRDADELVNDLSKLGKSTGYLSKNENDIHHKSKKFGTWVYPDLRLQVGQFPYTSDTSFGNVRSQVYHHSRMRIDRVYI